MRKAIVVMGAAVAIAAAVFAGGFILFGRTPDQVAASPAPKRSDAGLAGDAESGRSLPRKGLDAPGSPSRPGAEDECRAQQQAYGYIAKDGACVDLDKVVSGLKVGTYSYNRPDEGYVGRSFPVSLVLETAPGQNARDRLQGLAGETTSENARWSRVLIASLSGPGLQVEPKEPQRRLATKAEPVRWTWLVEPTRSGETLMRIEVFAEILVGEKALPPYQVAAFDAPIRVQVALAQQMEAFLGTTAGTATAVASLLSAVGGAILMARGQMPTSLF